MKETATVKIFLAQGDPNSIQTAEISNCTGKAFAGMLFPLDLILRREQSNKSGVHFLTGINSETDKERVYIDED